MNNDKWHSGPPPSCGWWIASSFGDEQCLRWWNGERWSIPAYKSNSAKYAGLFALQKTTLSRPEIQWQHRPDSWPARSRT